MAIIKSDNVFFLLFEEMSKKSSKPILFLKENDIILGLWKLERKLSPNYETVF